MRLSLKNSHRTNLAYVAAPIVRILKTKTIHLSNKKVDYWRTKYN